MGLFSPHGKEIVFAGWNGAGLPSALRIRHAPDYDIQRGEHFGLVRIHADTARYHQEPATDAHRGWHSTPTAPTQRHVEFPAYKAQREEMPEDLSAALPHVRRMIEAFNIPVITRDGFEADDIIGTLVRRAEKEDFESYHGDRRTRILDNWFPKKLSFTSRRGWVRGSRFWACRRFC